MTFEPYECYKSKFIFVPHVLLNKNKKKILLIDAQDRQQTLSKNTRIGTLSRDVTFSIYTTSQVPTKHVSFLNGNSSHHLDLTKQFKNELPCVQKTMQITIT